MSDLRSLYPCGRIARRRFLYQTAGGFLGSALSSLWADDGRLMQDARLPGTPKAKSVIFLFMCGGVSLSIRSIPKTINTPARSWMRSVLGITTPP